MKKNLSSKMISFRIPNEDYAKLLLISHKLYGNFNISKTIKTLLYSFLKDNEEVIHEN